MYGASLAACVSNQMAPTVHGVFRIPPLRVASGLFASKVSRMCAMRGGDSCTSLLLRKWLPPLLRADAAARQTHTFSHIRINKQAGRGRHIGMFDSHPSLTLLLSIYAVVHVVLFSCP